MELTTRLAKPEESSEFVQWSLGTNHNLYDPKAAVYSSTLTFVSEDSKGPVAYCPFQRPVMMEALAIRPGAKLISIARALRDLALTAIRIAKTVGAGEVLCFCEEKSTQEYMLRHGWERVDYPLYRLRVSEAERQYGEQPQL